MRRLQRIRAILDLPGEQELVQAEGILLFLDTPEGVSPALCRRAFIVLRCWPAELGARGRETLASGLAFESDGAPTCSKSSRANPRPSHMWNAFMGTCPSRMQHACDHGACGPWTQAVYKAMRQGERQPEPACLLGAEIGRRGPSAPAW